MNETNDHNEPSRLEQLQAEVTEKSREIWLAGLGALSSIEEEGARLYTGLVERGKGLAERSRKLEEEGVGLIANLVERGRRVEEEGRGRLHAVAENLAERQSQVTDKLEARVSGLVKNALSRLDIPTREEAQALKERVEALEKQLDALATARKKTAGRGADAGPKQAAPKEGK